MPQSVRNVVSSLALLLLCSCSLVVDFPSPREESGRRDAAVDAGKGDAQAAKPDATVDSGNDAGSVDASEGECAVENHRGCDKDELCCDRKDGKGALCIPTSGNECSVCGEACIDPKAPHCGARVCECKRGSGEGCPGKQTCMGEGAEARCVECTSKAECGEREVCVDNKCAQCSRGANPSDAADDEGCSGDKPICGASNTCVACSASPNNCPNPDKQQCVGGVGCVGCNPDANIALDQSGCPRSTPICKLSNGMYQCFGCTDNGECRGGYCDRATGTCTNVCDPQGAVGNNACTSGKPFCKRVGNDFACVACTALDCTAGRFCAVAGVQAGNCVQCRSNMDCPASANICNLTTGTCRGCAQDEVFDNATGQCVECATDANCSAEKGGLYCHPMRKQCVGCNMLPPAAGCATRNDGATPTCSPGGVCTGCTSDAQCTAGSATPFCVSGVCSACTSVAAGMADARCRTINMNAPACVASGRCAACDPADDSGCMAPNGQCDPTNFVCVPCLISKTAALDEGCSAAAPDCVLFAGGADRVCAACDPDGTALPARCAAGTTCTVPTSTPAIPSCTSPGGDAGTSMGPGIGIGIGPIDVNVPLPF